MCKCKGKCVVCKCAKYKLKVEPICESVSFDEMISDMEKAVKAFKEGKEYLYGNYAEYYLIKEEN